MSSLKLSYLMKDIIRKHIGLVKSVIEDPNIKNEQDDSLKICPDMATTHMVE